METQLKGQGAQAPGSVTPGMCGSTAILYDLHFDVGQTREVEIAFAPDRLQEVIREVIGRSGMTWLDRHDYYWPMNETGKKSVSKTNILGESHVYAETWTECLLIRGNCELCDFSRDNYRPTVDLAKGLILKLNPAHAFLQIIRRSSNRRPFEIGDQLEFTPAKGFRVLLPQYIGVGTY